MEEIEPAVPSVFLSYSWTSSEFAEQVVQLGRELADAGIHVVLDRWDLSEGQDKYAFMERSVRDPSITKVLILIDPRYAERADSRKGGVGTETLIISPEVYERADQQKFVPVVMARDEDGQVHLPAYLKGRIYIDLSDPEQYQDGFERLVRSVHGVPEQTRPPLGRRPSYLDEDAVHLITNRTLAGFRQAILQEKRNQVGYLDDYLERLATAYDAERVGLKNNQDELEVAVSESIDRWLPYRNEYIEMLRLLGRYGDRTELYDRLHAFLERLLNIREGQQSRWSNSVDKENLAFIGWELLLYTLAILLRASRFDGAQRVLRPFHVSDSAGRTSMETVAAIGAPFDLIQGPRQRRLGTKWLTAVTHLLRARLADGVTWEALAEADTLLWARTALSNPPERTWYPYTAALMEYEGPSTLPLWTRARVDSVAFEQIAPLLGIRDSGDAKDRLEGMHEGPQFHIGHVGLGRRQLMRMLGHSA